MTQKVQTTRFPVRGVAMLGDSQIVLVDTPGVFTPRRRLDRAMVRAAWMGAGDADIVVHLIDAKTEIASDDGAAKGADRLAVEDTASIVEGLKAAGRKAILALNKIDLVRRDRLLALSQRLFETEVYSGGLHDPRPRTSSGVDDLQQEAGRGHAGEPVALSASTRPGTCPRACSPPRSPANRSICACTKSCPTPPRSRRPTSQRPSAASGAPRTDHLRGTRQPAADQPVLGKGGQTLKWIGEASRKSLAEILGRPVHLFLTVKVKENWSDAREFYAGTGLDFDV